MRIVAILSMSYITTRIVKTKTSVAKILRVPVENQFTTLRAIKFSPCALTAMDIARIPHLCPAMSRGCDRDILQAEMPTSLGYPYDILDYPKDILFISDFHQIRYPEDVRRTLLF